MPMMIETDLKDVLNKLDQRFDRLDQKLDKIESDLTDLKVDMATVKADLTTVKEEVKDLRGGQGSQRQPTRSDMGFDWDYFYGSGQCGY